MEEVASKGIDPYRQEDQAVTILVDSQEEAVEGGRVEAEQLERSEEARAGDTTVEGEDGPLHGRVVDRTGEASEERRRDQWPSVRGRAKTKMIR